MEEFNPKKESVSYTIGIIKPDVVAKPNQVQEILTTIESNGFIILNMLQRELIKEEVINLFHKHYNKDYFDKIAKFMLNGESVIIMLGCDTENPIAKWKTLIGHSDPVEAKKLNPKSLRAIYGIDRIKNGLHGSDNQVDASKERDIFKFPVPQKVPEFKFEKFKITFDMLMKFIYPPNLEHPNVNSRLDIFALYGPVLNYHSVDVCLCNKCGSIGKEYLKEIMEIKMQEEKAKLGISSTSTNKLAKLNLSKSSTTNINSKFHVTQLRLIDETGIIKLWPQLCEKCRMHCESYTHLVCGMEQQHVMAEIEIKELVQEINHRDLLDLLKVFNYLYISKKIEKGSTANVMIETLNLIEPSELQYDRDLILLLFKDLETDYYGRYQFQHMQKMTFLISNINISVILEDRRIRLNAWVAKLTGKPLNRFKNYKLLNNTISKEQRLDPANINFTLYRNQPLTMIAKKKHLTEESTNFDPSIVDKPRLQPNEEKVVVLKLIHRHHHHLVLIDDIKDETFKHNIRLLRDGYNEGRHGGWDNYCCLKGSLKGSYVKTTKDEIKKND